MLFRSLALANENPSVAIIQIWIAVEDSVVGYGISRGFPNDRGVSEEELKMLLLKENQLDIKTVDLVTDLHRLRNEVFHENRIPSSEEANEFCKSAVRVKLFFDNLRSTSANLQSDSNE